jgi:hypothetical protein
LGKNVTNDPTILSELDPLPQDASLEQIILFCDRLITPNTYADESYRISGQRLTELLIAGGIALNVQLQAALDYSDTVYDFEREYRRFQVVHDADNGRWYFWNSNIPTAEVGLIDPRWQFFAQDGISSNTTYLEDYDPPPSAGVNGDVWLSVNELAQTIHFLRKGLFNWQSLGEFDLTQLGGGGASTINREILTGDFQVDSFTDTYNFLDPGGSDRIINLYLPNETKIFHFTNLNAAFRLTVQIDGQPSGVVLWHNTGLRTVTCIFDQTEWHLEAR